MLLAQGAAPLCGHDLVEAAAIGKAGEGIGDGQGLDSAVGVFQLLLCVLALADFAHIVENAAGQVGYRIADGAQAGFDPDPGTILAHLAALDQSAIFSGSEFAEGFEHAGGGPRGE